MFTQAFYMTYQQFYMLFWSNNSNQVKIDAYLSSINYFPPTFQTFETIAKNRNKVWKKNHENTAVTE